MTHTILVTGGAGFIGSHLCEFLLLQGHNVLCLDNLYSCSKRQIMKLQQYDSFKWLYHDLIHPIDLKVDAIYHLACPASPRYYQFDPIYTMKINVVGTMNMLELAKTNRAPILFTSTSEVYGNPKIHPQHESYTGNVHPSSPRACYDEGKRAAETLCFDYARKYDMDIHVVRIFNTYGPYMYEYDGRVVSNLITQALKGKPLTIYGEGSQTRSLCYIDDLIAGIDMMMHRSKRPMGPINLGNPHEVTIQELASMIVRLTQSASPFIYQALPIDDPLQRRPDISLAQCILGWQPNISLEAGLKKTIEYYRQVLKEEFDNESA